MGMETCRSSAWRGQEETTPQRESALIDICIMLC